LQDPPKFTQIGIFGLKTNHLATLLGCARCVGLEKSSARQTRANEGNDTKKGKVLSAITS
jgi:hypothetical protein